MHDALPVRGVQSMGDTDSQVEKRSGLQRSGFDKPRRRLAFQQLHDDEDAPSRSLMSWIVQMFVWFRALAARFALETLQRPFVLSCDSSRRNFRATKRPSLVSLAM